MRKQLIALSNGAFVAVDPEKATVHTSRDATTWTQIYPPASEPAKAKTDPAPRTRPSE